MRTEIIKVYRSVHTWVGISCALFLFVAFYCGAITMFKEPLAEWAALDSELPPAPSLEETPRLLRAVLEAKPEARKSHTVHFQITAANPARVTWALRPSAEDHHAKARLFGASLDAVGGLVVRELKPSPLADFIDTLHRQAGIPFDDEWVMWVVGFLCLLYFLALVSGVVILLPTLVRSLFLLRFQASNLRRRWLDMHNLLGLFSLPFHLVIASTALVFALHDEFYASQKWLLPPAQVPATPGAAPASAQPIEQRVALSPLLLRERLLAQAPEFELQRLDYNRGPAGVSVRVYGGDARHLLRGPSFGIGILDAYSGDLVNTDYFPGRQPAEMTLLTSFFSLHFGNFGGTPIRWAYVLLGFSGAFLFYTGNKLWIEARRRRSAESGSPVSPRSTRVLEFLTSGVCLGCIAGVSLTIASARFLPASSHLETLHAAVFYGVLACSTLFAAWAGGTRAARPLLWFSSLATLAIPVSSLLWLGVGNGLPRALFHWVDLCAFCAGILLAAFARLAPKGAEASATDSAFPRSI